MFLCHRFHLRILCFLLLHLLYLLQELALEHVRHHGRLCRTALCCFFCTVIARLPTDRERVPPLAARRELWLLGSVSGAFACGMRILGAVLVDAAAAAAAVGVVLWIAMIACISVVYVKNIPYVFVYITIFALLSLAPVHRKGGSMPAQAPLAPVAKVDVYDKLPGAVAESLEKSRCRNKTDN